MANFALTDCVYKAHLEEGVDLKTWVTYKVDIMLELLSNTLKTYGQDIHSDRFTTVIEWDVSDSDTIKITAEVLTKWKSEDGKINSMLKHHIDQRKEPYDGLVVMTDIKEYLDNNESGEVSNYGRDIPSTTKMTIEEIVDKIAGSDDLSGQCTVVW